MLRRPFSILLNIHSKGKPKKLTQPATFTCFSSLSNTLPLQKKEYSTTHSTLIKSSSHSSELEDHEALESINAYRPKFNTPLYSNKDIPWSLLKQKLKKNFVRSQLLAYLNESYSHYPSTLNKDQIIDEILHQWEKSLPTPSFPDNPLEITEACIPCTETDLFFIHGFGQMAQRLMVQSNVNIHLNKETKHIQIQGTTTQIKKTLHYMQSLLKYHHDQLSIPPQCNLDWNKAWTNILVQNIMKQCQVYIEEDSASSKLSITATSLLNLNNAKQLLKQLLDNMLDNRWYILNGLSKASLQEDKLALLPYGYAFHNDFLFHNLPTYKLEAIRGYSSSHSMFPLTSSSEAHPAKILKKSLNDPNSCEVSEKDIEYDHFTTLDTHYHLLQRLISNLPKWSSEFTMTLETMLGQTHFFISPETSSSSLSSSPFSLPWSHCLNHLDASNWFEKNSSLPLFHPIHHSPKSISTKEYTNHFTLVFSDENPHLQGSDTLPGKSHLVVELVLSPNSGSNNQNSLIVSKIYEKITPITIDSLDFTTSNTLRTNVHVTRSATPELFKFFETVMLPSLYLFTPQNQLFAPASFVWNEIPYHLTWIGEVRSRVHEGWVHESRQHTYFEYPSSQSSFILNELNESSWKKLMGQMNHAFKSA